MTPSDAEESATNDVTDNTIATTLSSERTREQKESLLLEARGNDVTNRTDPPVTFCRKIQTDSIYRQKFFDTVCLWISEFVFGFVYGQSGPTLPDLQQITEVNLDTASWLFTSFSLGYIFGCFLSAFLEKKTNPRLAMFICLLGMALFTIVTPWCSTFGFMVAARACAGVFYGGVDVGSHAFMFTIWRQDVNTYLQVFYFMLATGCLVAPIATTPFLSVKNDQSVVDNLPFNQSVNTISPILYQYNRSSSMLTRNNFENNSLSSFDATLFIAPSYSETHVHFSYLICGALTVLSSFPYLIIHLKNTSHIYMKAKKPVVEENDKQQNMKVRFLIVLIILTVLLSIRTGWTSTFSGFLTSFCSRHFGWNKAKGNLMTSLFFMSYAVGSLLCVLLVQFLRPGTMLAIFLLCFNASLVIFTVASIHITEVAIWISVSLMGFSLSATWPAVLAWTEERVTPITGRIASLLLFSGAVGQMVNPIAVGYLMDNISNSSFAFWHLGEAIFILVLFVAAVGTYWNVGIDKRNRKDMELKIENIVDGET